MQQLCTHFSNCTIFILFFRTTLYEPPKVERHQGVFISKLLSGGLAESATPKLVIGDEIIEVNGMEIAEKSARQVKDMMIAIYNKHSDLIITVKTSPPREMLNREMTPLIVSSLIAKNQNYGSILKTPIRGL